MKDYYKMLSIPFSADIGEIKKAYRKLAFQYHPDKNNSPDAAQKFILITEAYEVLRDERKRLTYDTLYEKYIKNKKVMVSPEPINQREQNEWAEYGKAKAREYSAMNYNDFTLRIIDELKLGVNYVPIIIIICVILFGIGGFISVLPNAFNEDNSIGTILIIFIIGYVIVAIYLVKKYYGKYTDARKRKFGN